MSAKTTKKKSRTDWKRLRKMADREIDHSDRPPLDASFFARAKMRLSQPKCPVSIRLDADLLDWFKAKGRGYQTRINEVLRGYVEAKKH